MLLSWYGLILHEFLNEINLVKIEKRMPIGILTVFYDICFVGRVYVLFQTGLSEGS